MPSCRAKPRKTAFGAPEGPPKRKENSTAVYLGTAVMHKMRSVASSDDGVLLTEPLSGRRVDSRESFARRPSQRDTVEGEAEPKPRAGAARAAPKLYRLPPKRLAATSRHPGARGASASAPRRARAAARARGAPHRRSQLGVLRERRHGLRERLRRSKQKPARVRARRQTRVRGEGVVATENLAAVVANGDLASGVEMFGSFARVFRVFHAQVIACASARVRGRTSLRRLLEKIKQRAVPGDVPGEHRRARRRPPAARRSAPRTRTC